MTIESITSCLSLLIMSPIIIAGFLMSVVIIIKYFYECLIFTPKLRDRFFIKINDVNAMISKFDFEIDKYPSHGEAKINYLLYGDHKGCFFRKIESYEFQNTILSIQDNKINSTLYPNLVEFYNVSIKRSDYKKTLKQLGVRV